MESLESNNKVATRYVILSKYDNSLSKIVKWAAVIYGLVTASITLSASTEMGISFFVFLVPLFIRFCCLSLWFLQFWTVITLVATLAVSAAIISYLIDLNFFLPLVVIFGLVQIVLLVGSLIHIYQTAAKSDKARLWVIYKKDPLWGDFTGDWNTKTIKPRENLPSLTWKEMILSFWQGELQRLRSSSRSTASLTVHNQV
mmetsp:Transcript_39600/g.45081  ORF Transcript_39600/g.45081 Transcript_39600/m.45081 type:complete len:200 (+) Transcript_39600:632-1231(+)